MKTDRELLDLAAKSAGMDVTWREVVRSRVAEYQIIKHTRHSALFTNDSKEWNPLTDDGDALRLAVKLRLPIHYRSTDCWGAKERSTVCGELTDQRNSERYENKVAHNDDAYAATRRAIVRAAALGETL